jgi:dTDP-D-glucose 4,6-dehydratase
MRGTIMPLYSDVYGPRELASSDWSIIKRILDGRKYLILPDGGLILQSHGYAENMAHAVMLAVDKPEASRGQIYNVRDEKVISVRERIELVSQVMNHEWQFIDIPGRLARPARPYAGWAHHLVLDITKIKNDLGYRDIVSVEEAIRRTVNWHLSKPPEPDGQMERNLRDPFDYTTEDRFIEEFNQAATRMREIPLAREPRHHPYPHPKEPGQLRDHRGR